MELVWFTVPLNDEKNTVELNTEDCNVVERRTDVSDALDSKSIDVDNGGVGDKVEEIPGDVAKNVPGSVDGDIIFVPIRVLFILGF